MSTPTLHTDATRAQASTPCRVRVLLRAARGHGVIQGTWWPRSGELTVELAALLAALSPRLGPIDRLTYDENDWASAPRSVEFRGRQVLLDRSDGQPTHTVSMAGDRFGRLVLLVVPPCTEPDRAYPTVTAAADSDDVSTADELLGIDARECRLAQLEARQLIT